MSAWHDSYSDEPHFPDANPDDDTILVNAETFPHGVQCPYCHKDLTTETATRRRAMIVARYWPLCDHCGRYMQRGRQVGGTEFCPEYEYDCSCSGTVRTPGRRGAGNG